MNQIIITLPLPPKVLLPTARSHWRAKMRPKILQRQDACTAATAAIYSNRKGGCPMWKMAEVQATWYLCRHNDSDNLLAWLKSSLDGIADAGIVDNDRGFVHLPPVQITGRAANGERKVVLVITPRKP